MVKQIKSFGDDQAYAIAKFFGTIDKFMQYRKYLPIKSSTDITYSVDNTLIDEQREHFITILCNIEYAPGKKLGRNRADKQIQYFWYE